MPMRRYPRSIRRAKKNRPVKRVMRSIRRYNARRFAKHYGSLFAERKWGCIQFGSTGTGGQITTGGTCSALGLDLGAPVASCFGTDVYDVPFALNFKLNYLNGYTEFTTLFDAYKLLGASCKLQTTLNTGTQPSTPVPYVEYIQDYDSGVAPNISVWNEKMGIKTKYFSSSRPSITLYARPRVNAVVYGSGVNQSFTWGQKNVWLDTAGTGPDTTHFGITGVIRNVWLPNGPSNQSVFTLDVHQKLILRDVQ